MAAAEFHPTPRRNYEPTRSGLQGKLTGRHEGQAGLAIRLVRETPGAAQQQTGIASLKTWVQALEYTQSEGAQRIGDRYTPPTDLSRPPWMTPGAPRPRSSCTAARPVHGVP